MVGAQKGALQRAAFIFSLFFIVLYDDLSPAFGTISTSKTIRESPIIPLKSMLAAIFTS